MGECLYLGCVFLMNNVLMNNALMNNESAALKSVLSRKTCSELDSEGAKNHPFERQAQSNRVYL